MISCGNCPYLDDCEENDECPFWEDDEWEVWDEELFVFNDGAILIELAEGRKGKVRVFVGECTHIDLNLNLLEETNEWVEFSKC